MLFIYSALVSGTCVISRVRDIDPDYLVAYLTSPYAQAWRTRLRQNITVEFTPYAELAEIPVVCPTKNVQTAIGNRIRKAERLQKLARLAWNRARRTLEDLLQLRLTRNTFSEFVAAEVNTVEYQCRSFVPAIANAVVYDELAAQYFHPRRIHARRLAAATESWVRLVDVADHISRANDAASGFVGLDVIDSETGIIDFSALGIAGAEAGCSSFQGNDLLFSRLRPYLNKVTVWPDTKGPGIGSGELLVYRARTIDPHYLFFVLKSQLGLNQVIDVTSGSTHPRVDAEVVDGIRIPRLNESDEVEIGDLVRQAHTCWYEAQDLLPQSRRDVEALINGTLDERRLRREDADIAAWLESNPIPESD